MNNDHTYNIGVERVTRCLVQKNGKYGFRLTPDKYFLNDLGIEAGDVVIIGVIKVIKKAERAGVNDEKTEHE